MKLTKRDIIQLNWPRCKIRGGLEYEFRVALETKYSGMNDEVKFYCFDYISEFEVYDIHDMLQT